MGKIVLGKEGAAPRNRGLMLNEEDVSRFPLFSLEPQRSYAIDEVRDQVIYGDCVAGMAQLPAVSFDLIIADPPYNIGKDFGAGTLQRLNDDDYATWTNRWLCEAIRLLKPNGSIYICTDWESSHIVRQVLSRYCAIKSRITWQREKGRGAARNWKNNMEDIWFAVMGDDYVFNVDEVKLKKQVIAPYHDEQGKPKDWFEEDGERYRLTYPSNIWTDITVPFWSMPENTPHPTQKPEKLIERIIRASSNPGGLILDPFLGSGTSGVVAVRTGRSFIGFEIDEMYNRLAQKRLMVTATAQAALL